MSSKRHEQRQTHGALRTAAAAQGSLKNLDEREELEEADL